MFVKAATLQNSFWTEVFSVENGSSDTKQHEAKHLYGYLELRRQKSQGQSYLHVVKQLEILFEKWKKLKMNAS